MHFQLTVGRGGLVRIRGRAGRPPTLSSDGKLAERAA